MLTSAIIRIFYLGTMFLAGLVLSNLASPEGFGTISVLVLNASLLSIVTGLGTDGLVLHKVSNQQWHYQKAARFSWLAIAVQVLMFLVVEIGSVVLRQRTLLSNLEASFLPVDAVYFLGLLLTEKFLSLLYAFQKARLANTILVVIAFLYLLLLVSVPYLKRTNFHTLLNLFALQSLAQGILLLVFFYRHYRTSGEERLALRDFLQLLKVSAVIMVTNVIQLLAYRLDFWLIQFFFGNYSVGIYAQANKFANLVWLAPNILAQLLIPRFAQLAKADVPRLFGAAFYFNLVGIAMTVACAGVFYGYYLNPEYKACLRAFMLMLPGYFFWGAVIYFAAYFSWAGKFTYNLFCSASCLVLISVSDLLLIPRFGIRGAALANSIAYTTVFLFYLFLLKRLYYFRLKELLLFPRRDFLKILKFVSR